MNGVSEKGDARNGRCMNGEFTYAVSRYGELKYGECMNGESS